MIYTGKCPHCGAVVRGGHGSPMKRIDTPIRKCPRCFRSYLDNNMYEWSVISPIYKFWYYFFANNRFFPWLILAIAAYRSWAYLLFGGLAWMAVCVLWVQITSKDKIKASKERTSRQEYIDRLVVYGYDKIATKHYKRHENSSFRLDLFELWLDFREILSGPLGILAIVGFAVVVVTIIALLILYY